MNIVTNIAYAMMLMTFYSCAMVAQSTFFMEEENGKARVFEQWGDDETTIETAMDTCPVNCIHYIPYDELVQLEIQRRDQFINVVVRTNTIVHKLYCVALI